jgi:hypothetical protein
MGSLPRFSVVNFHFTSASGQHGAPKTIFTLLPEILNTGHYIKQQFVRVWAAANEEEQPHERQ